MRVGRLCLAAVLAWALLIVFGVSDEAMGQQWRLPPQIGYSYPAGGRQGETFDIVVGGQRLAGVTEVHVSGQGVKAELLDYESPPSQREISAVRELMAEARKMAQQENKGRAAPQPAVRAVFLRLAEEKGITEKQQEAVRRFNQRRNDPKRQLNPQLAEFVTLRVTIDGDAAPGLRTLRLLARNGLSNPVRFEVDLLPEMSEVEPNESAEAATQVEALPVVLNGQIMPGDVDRFRLRAQKGQKLVFDVRARKLVPYLADAVPGWFQATAALYDSQGRQVAFVDDHGGDPDPLLMYEVEDDGEYVFEIRDSIYRGREDFVYRVAVGELPVVTSFFPLGGRVGTKVPVELTGWNLPDAARRITVDAEAAAGRHRLPLAPSVICRSALAFASDELDDAAEQEPNDSLASAQGVRLPLVINGRVSRAGDVDVFSFEAKKGWQVVAEVQARRLGSPLDSQVEILDAAGRPLAVNDDQADPAMGLLTHYADSYVGLTIPEDGRYLVRLVDVQGRGGSDYSYRLRVSRRRPDFELRVVPSAMNCRGGSTVPVTVHAIRRDGFEGDIELRLKDAPAGFELSGGLLPAGQQKVTMTLAVPTKPEGRVNQLRLEGVARLDTGAGGDEAMVIREARAADEMMQAFAYQHLVTTDSWLVAVEPGRWAQPRWEVLSDGPLRIVAGETVRVQVKSPPRPPAGKVLFELHEGPPGVTIGEITPTEGGLVVELKAEAGVVPVGWRGNLILQVILERQIAVKADAPPRGPQRIPSGYTAAVGLEIVGDDVKD